MDFSILGSGNLVLLALLMAAAGGIGWAWAHLHAAGSSQPAAGRPRTLDAVDTVIGWPPEATRVLTSKHQRALDLLRQAVPQHVVLAQVPISHFIKVPTRYSYVEWQRRIGHVCVDLMVCDDSSQVLAVIELRQPDRVLSERTRKRYTRIERVLRAAGIPVHLWNEAMLPDPAAIRKAFTAPPAPAEAAQTVPEARQPVPARIPGQPGEPLPAGRQPALGLAAKDPPGTSWFDELNATRPTQLDGVDVVTHDAGHPALGGVGRAPVVVRPEH